MLLSLREAAEQAGKTKPAILKAIQKGVLSATRNEKGEWQIDPTELFRVYPPHTPVTTNQNDEFTAGTPQGNTETLIMLARLEAENEALRERLQEKETSIQELKEQRNSWQAQAERLTKLLPAPSPEEIPIQTTTEQPQVNLSAATHPNEKRSWWQRLFG